MYNMELKDTRFLIGNGGQSGPTDKTAHSGKRVSGWQEQPDKQTVWQHRPTTTLNTDAQLFDEDGLV